MTSRAGALPWKMIRPLTARAVDESTGFPDGGGAGGRSGGGDPHPNATAVENTNNARRSEVTMGGPDRGGASENNQLSPAAMDVRHLTLLQPRCYVSKFLPRVPVSSRGQYTWFSAT